MTSMSRVLAVIFFSVLVTGNVAAQPEKKDKKEVFRLALQKAVENRRYHFLAQNAIPAGGSNRLLTTPYTLSLLGDTLDSDLPYFGRAYTADITGTEGGIRFTSTDFTYTVTPGKKDGWEIRFIPKNQASASRMYLSMGADGYATLSVESTNRQTISFYGAVSPNKRQ